jgi:hypothetical protein
MSLSQDTLRCLDNPSRMVEPRTKGARKSFQLHNYVHYCSRMRCNICNVAYDSTCNHFTVGHDNCLANDNSCVRVREQVVCRAKMHIDKILLCAFGQYRMLSG